MTIEAPLVALFFWLIWLEIEMGNYARTVTTRALVALVLLVTTAALGGDSHADWVRAALGRAPVGKLDKAHPERLEQRAKNLDAFAAEIARVSEKAPLPKRQWAALLATIGSIESNYDTEIVAGRCPKFACDRGRAKGAFQVHRTAPVADMWPRADGDPAVQVAMADKMLRLTWRRCEAFVAFPASAFRGYGGQRSCSWPVAREVERVSLFGRFSQ